MRLLRALWRRTVGRRMRESKQQSLRQRMAEAGVTEYPQRHYDDEEAARQAVSIVDDYTMISYERLVTLWQQVRYLDRAEIPGCLVECGTWKGGACGMMALAHLAGEAAMRPIHLFDSFRGLPEPDGERDGDAAVTYAAGRASGALTGIGRCMATLEENQRLMREVIGYPEDLTRYHVGWFQQTVPAAAAEVGPIALLRLDGDWYESTKICLDWLGSRVSPGGIVIVDDYGKWAGCRRAVNEFLGRRGRPLLLNHIDATGRYWIAP